MDQYTEPSVRPRYWLLQRISLQKYQTVLLSQPNSTLLVVIITTFNISFEVHATYSLLQPLKLVCEWKLTTNPYFIYKIFVEDMAEDALRISYISRHPCPGLTDPLIVSMILFIKFFQSLWSAVTTVYYTVCLYSSRRLRDKKPVFQYWWSCYLLAT